MVISSVGALFFHPSVDALSKTSWSQQLHKAVVFTWQGLILLNSGFCDCDVFEHDHEHDSLNKFSTYLGEIVDASPSPAKSLMLT